MKIVPRRKTSEEIQSLKNKILFLQNLLGSEKEFIEFTKEIGKEVQQLLETTAANNDTKFQYNDFRIMHNRYNKFIEDFYLLALKQDVNLALIYYQIKTELKLVLEFKSEFVIR
jgi:hypothetical protein